MPGGYYVRNNHSQFIINNILGVNSSFLRIINQTTDFIECFATSYFIVRSTCLRQSMRLLKLPSMVYILLFVLYIHSTFYLENTQKSELTPIR